MRAFFRSFFRENDSGGTLAWLQFMCFLCGNCSPLSASFHRFCTISKSFCGRRRLRGGAGAPLRGLGCRGEAMGQLGSMSGARSAGGVHAGSRRTSPSAATTPPRGVRIPGEGAPTEPLGGGGGATSPPSFPGTGRDRPLRYKQGWKVAQFLGEDFAQGFVSNLGRVYGFNGDLSLPRLWRLDLRTNHTQTTDRLDAIVWEGRVGGLGAPRRPTCTSWIRGTSRRPRPPWWGTPTGQHWGLLPRP